MDGKPSNPGINTSKPSLTSMHVPGMGSQCSDPLGGCGEATQNLPHIRCDFGR